MDIDIIALDLKIQQHFQSEAKNISFLDDKIQEINRIVSENQNLDSSILKKLEETKLEYQHQIKSIQTEQNFNFYMIESLPIIEEYKTLLRTPLKMSFVGSCKNNDFEKDRLIHKYLTIAKKFATFHIFPSFYCLSPKLCKNTSCDDCKSKNIILSEGVTYICVDCGYEKEAYVNTLSYKDISRTNIIQKYTYERRSHFRDCINQYQGKQNCKIDPDIYKDLENEFEKHHILVGDQNTAKEIRYRNVELDHVMLFLKELGYDKQYENARYIYSYITGKKYPDLSHLEDQLMTDFDILVNLYIKKFKYEKKIDRKSFMNIHYVFFQLLNKNKYACKKEDFNILKTVDRKAFHDDVFKELFEELGWNHTPFF
jgi:hypothetical protein